jgi:hypothetical protein
MFREESNGLFGDCPRLLSVRDFEKRTSALGQTDPGEFMAGLAPTVTAPRFCFCPSTALATATVVLIGFGNFPNSGPQGGAHGHIVEALGNSVAEVDVGLQDQRFSSKCKLANFMKLAVE